MATDAQPQVWPQTLGRRIGTVRQNLARQMWLPPALLFLAAGVLYWLTRTHDQTFDAVSYAVQIGQLYPRTGDRHWLFHPHHLLFNVTGYALWRLAGAFGYGGGPLIVLQRLNAALGALGVVLFYLTLRRLLRRSRWLPLLVSTGLALSYGYWVCATDGRVNMPSTALLLGALLLLTYLLERLTVRRAAALGALSGAAVLYHESAGLFLLVGLAGVLIAEQDALLLPAAARRRRIEAAAAYLAVWALVIALPYLLIGTLALGLRSAAGFRHWMATYAELGWWWDFHFLHDLRMDAYALRRAAFVEPPGKQGTFHLSPGAPAALRALYFAALAGWFAAVYAFCVALPLLWRSHNRRVMVVSLAWIVLYAAFFTVWNPGYFVFWVPVLIPTGVLLTLALAHYRARRGGIGVNWLVGLWIALYASVNVLAGIGPHRRPGTSPFQRIAADVRAHTRPGDLILLSGTGDLAQCEVDIPYFADRDAASLHTALTRAGDDKTRARAALQAQIDRTLASGRAVYALDDLWHSPRAEAAIERRHGFTPADRLALFQPYDRTVAWQSVHGPVWRLTLRGQAGGAPIFPQTVSTQTAGSSTAPRE